MKKRFLLILVATAVIAVSSALFSGALQNDVADGYYIDTVKLEDARYTYDRIFVEGSLPVSVARNSGSLSDAIAAVEAVAENPANISDSNHFGNDAISINLSGFDLGGKSLINFGLEFVETHPGYFYLKTHIGSYGNELIIFTSSDAETAISRQADFKAATDRALSWTTPDMNDYEKALVLHDYICMNAEYDLTYTKRTAYDILVDRTAVCQGYTLTYNYLLSLVGIDSRYVSTDDSAIGSQQNHAWSAVKLDGKWYYVDVTHDDPITDRAGRARKDHFLLSESEIRSCQMSGYDRSFDVPAGVSAADTSYQDILSEIDSGILGVGGKYYYVKTGNSGKVILYSTDNAFDLSLSTALYTTPSVSGSYVVATAVVPYGGYLIFSAPRGIYYYNTKDGATGQLESVSGNSYIGVCYDGNSVLAQINSVSALQTINVTSLVTSEGRCGPSLTWAYDSGRLTISGTGAMYNYSAGIRAPWSTYVSSINNFVINNGVTTIGSRAFSGCTALTNGTIGSSVETVGDCAFANCPDLASVYFLGAAPSSFGGSVFLDADSDFTIYYIEGKSGWTTPTWKEYRCLPISPYDLNDDSVFNILDAVYFRTLLLTHGSFTEDDIGLYDFNSDGEVGVADLIKLLELLTVAG